MSFISSIDPEQATQEVASLYRHLQGQAAYLPNYARVFCHRPDIMTPISALQKGIASGLSPRLWALVSLAVAREIKVSYCALVYARRLVRGYFDEVQLLAVLSTSADAPISNAERAAMLLAAKVARDSSAVTQADIDELRELAYSDTDIFNIVAAAAYRCFFAKISDALGAQPDAPLGDLDETLLDCLVVGRQIESDARGATEMPLARAQTRTNCEKGQLT